MTIVDTSLSSVDLHSAPTAAGRHEFYAQIATHERELSAALAKLEPRRRPRPSTTAATRPHLLSGQELESTRDDLVARISDVQGLVALQSAARSGARALLKRMTDVPADFRWATVTTKDLGSTECREWQSVPVLGPIGILANWWRIRISSGCP